ncbi:transposase [Pseudovibrio ascidiaceicola]|uniref:transposase n=1 Tax=Pseudovibrio ascidiaceicola TaxID=285279 RepID=UPI003D35C627
MGRGTKRRFTDDFKDEAVARLSQEGASYKSVSTELGLTPPQLKSWHLERLAAGSSQALARQKSDATELSKLRKELKETREENEILRKASAFFAQWAGKT